MQFEVAPFGERALLISSDRTLVGYQQALATFGRVRAGMTSLLIEGVDPARATEIKDFLLRIEPETEFASKRLHLIEVSYDGPDLSQVASLLGVTADQVVSAHLQAEWTVAMVGFAPGFAYLTTRSTDLFDAIPRLEVPRAKVPAGSLALAAGMSAIYPTSTPGGWQLIGQSDVTLFDVDAKQPSLLLAGDTVRFKAK